MQATAPPPERQAHWLHVKHGDAFLWNARLYWPKPEALDERWLMPAVQHVD